MSSTFLAPSTVTRIADKALTTPFVQTGRCESLYDLVTIPIFESASNGPSTISSAAFLISDVANRHFSACQPNGWDNQDPASQFHFSPAVCTSYWTYYEMMRTSTDFGNGTLAPYSTAYCCASLTAPCYRYIDAGWTSTTVTVWSTGTKTTKVFSEGYMAHAAWEISWAASDTASMSPTPPSLDSGEYFSTWVPGQALITPTPEPTKHQTDKSLTKLLNFYMIGLPLIGVAVIACGIWCCCMVRRAKRRETFQLEQWRLEHPTSISQTAQNPSRTPDDPSKSPGGALVGAVASGAPN
ncbi:uncharacterized protein N7500_006854 [Penicillium coprophilum]|uniref:uncharacterized protein n=1 Tax=Penicillium coprophilum TaxID=36646 RepID=UPI0023A287B3|nr:uncharacterized protein N7500_006854 [Penicillium coprophilum]KAJ5165024.1 hypothetical protein N7500_006854 [Penicillium coprophilum]